MIVFAWDGFPQYAARCVGAFVRTTTERVAVVATSPTVPIKGMENLCGCPVHWISPDEPFNLSTFQPFNLSTFFVTGWYVPAFNRLRDAVRAKGGRIICMLDNNMVGGGLLDLGFRDCLIEILKSVRFRMKFRKHFDGFIVPGKSGRKLLRFYGVPDEKILEGFYAADETLFTPGPTLGERPKKIIYVGRFCERKNVRRMLEAFRKVKARGEGEQRWELHLYGSGPLKEELDALASASRGGRDGTVEIHDFLQPEELAAKYREARIFCLPSVEEHWGLVVHEAALSGCALLLSNRVGAAEDFLEEGVNGLSFNPFDVDDMAAKFAEAMTRTFETERAAEKAREMGVKRFVKAVERFQSRKVAK